MGTEGETKGGLLIEGMVTWGAEVEKEVEKEVREEEREEKEERVEV